MRLMHSPLRPANSTLKTPSPVRMGPSSYFATPGGLPRTPLSESMQLTAWLRETLATCSAEVTFKLQYLQCKYRDPSLARLLMQCDIYGYLSLVQGYL